MNFVSAEQFTRYVSNPQQLIDRKIYYPRIIISTPGCIGTGLNSVDVYSVCQVGFPSSILDMVHAIGCCGRCRVDGKE